MSQTTPPATHVMRENPVNTRSPESMPLRAVANVSELPTVTFGSQNVAWWGTIGFMAIEGMTLALCLASYLYLRKNFVTWPPEMTPRPALGVPALQILVMFGSIVPMTLAGRAAKRLDAARARNMLGVAILVKLVILVLRWYEFKALNTRWNSDAYGAIAWVTLGFHTTLLVLDVGEDMGLWLVCGGDWMRNRFFSDLADDVMYWKFTVATWFVLAPLVFLTPIFG